MRAVVQFLVTVLIAWGLYKYLTREVVSKAVVVTKRVLSDQPSYDFWLGAFAGSVVTFSVLFFGTCCCWCWLSLWDNCCQRRRVRNLVGTPATFITEEDFDVLFQQAAARLL